jgi:hypothetical protein
MRTTAIFVHLAHICIFGSLFLYVGIQRGNSPQWLYSPLLALSVVGLAYHSYKTYLRIFAGKNPWVNLIHLLVVSPIVAYIGYYREQTPRYVFEILLMLGFASIGYHGLYLLEEFGVIATHSTR